MGTDVTEERWPNRAIVVIHGIGEQRRGNTLDALVRGMKRCGVTDSQLVQVDKEFGEPLPGDVIRLTRGETKADVYEVYWAPHTARKTTARSVLWWLYRASFIPPSKLKFPSPKTWWDITAAILASLLLAFLTLYAVSSLGNLSAQVACRTDPDVECELPSDQRKITGPEVTWAGIGQGIAVAQAIGGSIQLGDKPLKELTPEHAAEVLTQVPLTYWVLLLVIAFLATHSLFRAAQVVTGLVQGRPRWRANRVGWQMMMLLVLLVFLFLLIQMVAPVMTAFVLILVIVGSFLRTVSRFLAESLGDVQVYSERDENSEHYAAREAVLEEAEKTFALVAERRYVEIVVLGHSLGSVVAFTALDRLRRRVPPLLHHIEAIITFGTALEKVRYFFERRKDPDEEASARLVQPAVEIANDRVWLNLWYANDLVANPITTFQAPGADPKGYKFGEQPRLPALLTEARTHLVVNINFGYPVARFPLVWTHSRYWGDKEAMQLITDVALPQ